jgi:hypothetical protein
MDSLTRKTDAALFEVVDHHSRQGVVATCDEKHRDH